VVSLAAWLTKDIPTIGELFCFISTSAAINPASTDAEKPQQPASRMDPTTNAPRRTKIDVEDERWRTSAPPALKGPEREANAGAALRDLRPELGQERHGYYCILGGILLA
jgi:hypothetical protein